MMEVYQNSRGVFMKMSKIFNGIVKYLVVPYENFGGGWRSFVNYQDNLVGRCFCKNKKDSRMKWQKKSGFQNSMKFHANSYARPWEKHNFRSMQNEFPNNPKKKIGDFIERRKEQRHSRS